MTTIGLPKHKAWLQFRAKELITRLGHPAKFREYLAGFRERNKRKKNLLWLLDREFGPGNG